MKILISRKTFFSLPRLALEGALVMIAIDWMSPHPHNYGLAAAQGGFIYVMVTLLFEQIFLRWGRRPRT
ncbi:MAG TPA: hypothetical protein VHW65_10815 [Gemmatimonadales bacterium]|nr:hypothetical protein [Gemmatimonadales bacterium]